MCTVSWAHQPGGYHLLCNRDEKRSRGAALPPRFTERGGVRYIAPSDPDFGGTWIAVNEYGLSVCLLNGDSRQPGRRSRGLLVPELAWAPSAGECALWLRQLDLNPYASFTVLMLEPGLPAIVADWDGASLTVDRSGDTRMPLTSSSFDPAGVRSFRLNDFATRTDAGHSVDPADLYWFHRSHGSQPDAYTPCMHRGDAETVSFSWTVVTRDEVRFLYSPSAPCQWSPSRQHVLARAA